MHAAKKLVCSNVMAMGPVGSTGGTVPLPPDIEVQHGIALLTTALRAIDTCLQAAAYLSNPAALTAVSGGGGGGGGIAGGQLLPLAATEEDAGIIMNDYGDSAAAAGAVITPRQLSASASAVALPPLPLMAARTTAPAATPTGHSNTMLVRTATTRYSSRSSSFNTVATTVGTAYATAGTGNAYAPSLGRTSPSRSEAAAPSEPSEMTSNHSLGGGPWHPQPHPGAPPPSAADINMAASISLLPTTADPTSPTSVAGTDAAAPAALFPAAGGGIHAGLAAAMGQSQGVSLFTSHWSAHLHSLIAQLHWDIGVQRHRRRRQHAAAQVRPGEGSAGRVK